MENQIFIVPLLSEEDAEFIFGQIPKVGCLFYISPKYVKSFGEDGDVCLQYFTYDVSEISPDDLETGLKDMLMEILTSKEYKREPVIIVTEAEYIDRTITYLKDLTVDDEALPIMQATITAVHLPDLKILAPKFLYVAPDDLFESEEFFEEVYPAPLLGFTEALNGFLQIVNDDLIEIATVLKKENDEKNPLQEGEPPQDRDK